MPEFDTVTFGIPLLARSAAQDWARIERQLSATVGSIYNQSDGNFRIIVAGTDQPALSTATDERYEFIAVDQLPTVDHTVFITDAIRKRYRIAQKLRERGGGYLMFADADDLVSRDLVAFVRKTAHPNGYLIAEGYMFDAAKGWLAPFPFTPDASFDQESHTCAVLILTAEELPRDDDDHASRFGYLMAHGHPAFRARAAAEGRPLLDMPFRAAVYVRNTGENVSTREASTTRHGRTVFQAWLDDQVEARRVERTPELDAEFNLKAAEAPHSEARLRHAYRPFIGLSVLVATHKRPDGLRRLLAALRPQVQGHPERSVVVINDGSHDAAYEAVAAEFADTIEYHALPKAAGLGAVRNAGVERCRGAYAVFTDDDCEPPPWWLDWLAARLTAHPEIDVVVGTTMPLWEKKDFGERFQGEWFLPRPSRLGRWQVFVTANVAIRTRPLREVGGFMPTVNVGEDTELCIRLHRNGARFVVDEQWWVRHQVRKPFVSLVRRHRVYGEAQARIGAAMAVEVPRGIGGGARQRIATFVNVWRGYFVRRQPFENPVARIGAATMAAVVIYAYLRGLARPPTARQ